MSHITGHIHPSIQCSFGRKSNNLQPARKFFQKQGSHRRIAYCRSVRAMASTHDLALIGFVGVPTAITAAITVFAKMVLPARSGQPQKDEIAPLKLLLVLSFMFVLLGYGADIVWQHGGFREQQVPLALWFVSVAMIYCRMTLVTAGAKPSLILAQIIVLVVCLYLTVATFFAVQPLAAYLMGPITLFTTLKTLDTIKAFANAPQTSGSASLPDNKGV